MTKSERLRQKVIEESHKRELVEQTWAELDISDIYLEYVTPTLVRLLYNPSIYELTEKSVDSLDAKLYCEFGLWISVDRNLATEGVIGLNFNRCYKDEYLDNEKFISVLKSAVAYIQALEKPPVEPVDNLDD